MKKSTGELLKDLEKCEDFGTYYEGNKDVFLKRKLTECLDELLKQKNMKKIDVIKGAEMSQIYGYQIFAGMRRPGKYKMICIALAMGLTYDETQALLKECGFIPLYAKNADDSAYIYALKNRLTVAELNGMLVEYGLKESIEN